MKKCPHCAEEIQDAAIVCWYCGRDFYKGEDAPILKKKIKTNNLGPILLPIGYVQGELFAIHIVNIKTFQV